MFMSYYMYGFLCHEILQGRFVPAVDMSLDMTWYVYEE